MLILFNCKKKAIPPPPNLTFLPSDLTFPPKHLSFSLLTPKLAILTPKPAIPRPAGTWIKLNSRWALELM